MSDEIQKGDVVRLKSGGPPMTVTYIGPQYEGGENRAWCEWFNEKNSPCAKDFALAAVEKVQPSPKGPLAPKSGSIA